MEMRSIANLANGLPQPVCTKWFAANHFTQRGKPATEMERPRESQQPGIYAMAAEFLRRVVG